MLSAVFITALAAASSVLAHDLIDIDALAKVEIPGLADVVGVLDAEVLRSRSLVDVDAIVGVKAGQVLDAAAGANLAVFRRNLVAAATADVAHVIAADGTVVISKRDLDVDIDIKVKLDGLLSTVGSTVEGLCGQIDTILDGVVSAVDADLKAVLEPLLQEVISTIDGAVPGVLGLASPSGKTRRSAMSKRDVPTDAVIANDVAHIINTVIKVLNRVEKLTHDLHLPLVSGLLDDIYTALNPVLGRLLAAVGQLLANVLQLVAHLLGDATGFLGHLPILGTLLSSLGSLPALLGAILRA